MSMAGPDGAAFASHSSRFAALGAERAFLISLASLPTRGRSSFGSLPSCSSAPETTPLRPRYLALSWSSAGSSVHAAIADSASARAVCSCCSSSVILWASLYQKRLRGGQHLLDGDGANVAGGRADDDVAGTVRTDQCRVGGAE